MAWACIITSMRICHLLLVCNMHVMFNFKYRFPLFLIPFPPLPNCGHKSQGNPHGIYRFNTRGEHGIGSCSCFQFLSLKRAKANYWNPSLCFCVYLLRFYASNSILCDLNPWNQCASFGIAERATVTAIIIDEAIGSVAEDSDPRSSLSLPRCSARLRLSPPQHSHFRR